MRVEYSVTTLSPEKQLVQVHWYGDDYAGTSKYIAEENRVEPLYSETSDFILPILFALFFAWMPYRLGKWLLKNY